MIERILVTVMTYPTLSDKHFETVCTAGFHMDGSWVRIYPVPHRMLSLNGQPMYHKWQVIEVDLEKSPSDNRPESYRIHNIDTLKIHGKIDANRPDWELRMSWLKKGKEIYDDMSKILERTYYEADRISLAVLRPTEITGFDVEAEESLDDYNHKLQNVRNRYKAEKMQLSLFGDNDAEKSSFEFARKIPYKFYYRFKTNDGKERRLMIEDWEIGMLYLHCLKGASPEVAIDKVREKYTGFITKNEVYLLLGTQYKWQNKKAPNPYVIIGVVAAPKGVGTSLYLPLDY